ncbi:MAG: hypothetical protein WAZ60_23900 [Desulfosalsimonadaceae bacterium]
MNAEELKYMKALQPGIREAMGNRWNIGDKGYCAEHDSYYYYGDHLEEMCCDEEGIRIPLAIDPENPGRGLQGMCSPPVQLTPIYNPYQDNVIICWEATWSIEKCGENKLIIVGADTPYLALLKSLAAQWGVEVEG